VSGKKPAYTLVRSPVRPSIPSSSPGREEGAFGPYARAVRHHPWLVAAVTLVAVLVSIAWLSTRETQYESTAQILVTPIAEDSSTGLPLLTDSVDPTRVVQTAATILDSPKAATVAARSLRGWTPETLADAVRIDAQGDSNVVAVTAQTTSPASAATVANAYAVAALAARRTVLGAEVDLQLAGLEAQRRALAGADPTTAAELAGRIAELEQIRDGRDPNFSLLQTGGEGTAIGTPAWMIVALALIGGLVVGVGAALLLEQLDRRLRDEDSVVEQYPLPILTRIPVMRRRGGIRGMQTPEIREAFRTLQVQLESDGDRSRIVLFTSASAGDGKTTSALDFSYELVASGCRVVLLDFDLRKPEIGGRVGVSSDVLALFRSNATLSDVLVPAPDEPELKILSAAPHGDISPVLEALSQRLPELLAQAREMADYVIIDTAPLGRVSDALRIAAMADDVLLVVRPNNTNTKDLRITRELLEHVGVVPTGLIVVGSNGPAHGGYYGYGRKASPPPALKNPSVASLDGPGGARGPADRLDILP
jgi:tyrosine-protein kinase